MPLYDRIGGGYDSTRRADPYLVRRMMQHLEPQKGRQYLDVACGTGNYTVSLAKAGVHMVGLDHSARMIETARTKSGSVNWVVGDAQALPFADRHFSGAVCTLAIHHFPGLVPVFREVFRVMNSGRFVLFTSTYEQMKGYWLNEYFPDMMRRSCEQMPSFEQVTGSLKAVGFTHLDADIYEVQPDLQDFFLYSGKHRPESYLDATVRAGSSSFATLADPREIETGCRRLEVDIRSGRIHQVTESFRHSLGDYVFIVARK